MCSLHCTAIGTKVYHDLGMMATSSAVDTMLARNGGWFDDTVDKFWIEVWADDSMFCLWRLFCRFAMASPCKCKTSQLGYAYTHADANLSGVLTFLMIVCGKRQHYYTTANNKLRGTWWKDSKHLFESAGKSAEEATAAKELLTLAVTFLAKMDGPPIVGAPLKAAAEAPDADLEKLQPDFALCSWLTLGVGCARVCVTWVIASLSCVPLQLAPSCSRAPLLS